MKSKLVLASQSPRRRELLATLGVEFETISCDIDESVLNNEEPEAYVIRLAVEKAQAGFRSLEVEGETWVLGSDTSVVSGREILGKPVSKADFQRMMILLSDKQHRVLTSVALVNNNQVFTDLVQTSVTFMALTDEQVDAYWESGEPCDKAGGYGIQGYGSAFVTDIQGSYSAVVGLPLHQTAKILGKAHLPIWQSNIRL